MLPMTIPKRMDKDEQSLISQLARALKIPVAIDVYDWCELGERWSEREDTSANVVTIKLPRQAIKYSLPLAWAIISKLPKIAEVRFDRNEFEGGFPETVPHTLERLFIDNNPLLGGQLPQSMRFRNLTVLWLNNCGIKGQLPYSIGEMWALKQLNLSNNKLTGRLPDSWATLPSLEVLDMRQNKVKGSLPRSFRDLTSLVQLDLSFNRLSGEIQQNIFTDLKHLEWLNLANCNFLDAEKSHKELEQQLPMVKVLVYIPKRVHQPSPLPTFPRKNKYTVEREVAAKAAQAAAAALAQEQAVANGSDSQEDSQMKSQSKNKDDQDSLILDSNGIPININDSQIYVEGGEEEEDEEEDGDGGDEEEDGDGGDEEEEAGDTDDD